MGFEVFDFRKDLRNVFVSPEIRSRFLRLEPGEIHNRHSHDLGQEVFLVLDGEVEFEIEGDRKVLRPGQMCIARVDEKHQVSCYGDNPAVMYLSVTPHVEPTHTSWEDETTKLPPQYGQSTRAERNQSDSSAESSTEQLAAQLTHSTDGVAASAAEAATIIRLRSRAAVQALDAQDREAARGGLDQMWSVMYKTIRQLHRTERIWNEYTARFSALNE